MCEEINKIKSVALEINSTALNCFNSLALLAKGDLFSDALILAVVPRDDSANHAAFGLVSLSQEQDQR